MRLLVDECCARALVEMLRRDGHDVAYVVEDARGSADDDLAERARREERVLVTQDYGFGGLILRDRVSIPGAVLIGGGSLPLGERYRRVAEVIADLGPTLIGAITRVDAGRVRRRSIG